MSQPDAVFMQAFDTVRRRYSVDEWLSLPPRQITRQIYDEMRRLDLMRAEKMLLSPPRRRRPGSQGRAANQSAASNDEGRPAAALAGETAWGRADRFARRLVAVR
jgi:hypothetical protein